MGQMLSKTLSGRALLLAAGLLLSVQAQAGMWSVDSVLGGTDAGFGFSSFHDASNGSVMNGPSLGLITGTGGLGSFNDATGYLDFTASSDGGDTDVEGSLDFGGTFGFLVDHSDLSVSFDSPTASLTDDTFTFKTGNVCCNGGVTDPNSFTDQGNDTAWITLWGANGWNGSNFDNGSGGKTTVGMDLRLELTRVPEPSALILLAMGLLGVGFKRLGFKKVGYKLFA